ncbi:MAG TPA: hypothetical protein VN958_17820 [Chitinophagaceae bacterium]|nr:hypothetical protein [Chitinophagaceae bacterium]
MKQNEAVIITLEKLGGIATLGQLYQETMKIKDCVWKTKTPFASIRRIVQLDKNIYRIKPGLYGLMKYKTQNELKGFVAETSKNKNSTEIIEFNHSYYQGLLIAIGNLKGFQTFIPNQDKNKRFIDSNLGAIRTLNDIPQFSFPTTVQRSSTIDVIWFNERKMPDSFFEVEHSTDIQNSLLKYYDLQDFYSKFYIIGAKERLNEFIKKINYHAFTKIKSRIEFKNYEFVSNLHTKIYEISEIGNL